MTESLLTPEEERELLEAIATPSPEKQENDYDNDDDFNSSSSSDSRKKKSSSSSSTNSTSYDSRDDTSTSTWDAASSSSSSSSTTSSSRSSSSSSSSSSSVSSSEKSASLQTISCDVSADTRALFSTLNNAWLLRENGFTLEKVRLWFYEAAAAAAPAAVSTNLGLDQNNNKGDSNINSSSPSLSSSSASSGWHHQDQVVCVSRAPFSIGAMRASFFLSDVTRQASPTIIEERLNAKSKQNNNINNNSSGTSSSSEDPAAKLLNLLNLPTPTVSLVVDSCSFKKPFLDTASMSTNTPENYSDISCNRELYVAKSYRRFLHKKPSALSAPEKNEEMRRHFRDAHMQSVAQHWVDLMNRQQPPCPRLNFVPVWVMQRLEKVTVPPPSSSSSTSTDDGKKEGCHTTHKHTHSPKATSSSCEFFSVEPMLHGVFTKHNNNNGFVRGNNPASPSSVSSSISSSPQPQQILLSTPLEMEVRDGANALVHFSYKRSNRTLSIVDIQGVGISLTDPQIHTIDGIGFGRGNLGPKGMYKCLKSHRCSRVCAALKLEKLNMEEERVYLKEMDRKRRRGEFVGKSVNKFTGGEGEIPVELERMTASKHLDFNF